MTKSLETWHVSAGTEVRRGRTSRTPSAPPDPEPTLWPFRYGFHAGNPTSTVGGGGGFDADYATISGYLTLSGTPEVYRCFYDSAHPPTLFPGSNADKGPPVVVSFKYTPTEILGGTKDAALTAWFNSIPSDRQVWWCYYHEPENDIEKGSFTAANYRLAWDHIIALAPKRDTLLPVVILMEWTLFKPSRTTSDYVTTNPDLHGLFWDAYLTANPKNIDGVVWKSKAESDRFGLAYGICETSVAPGYNYTGMTHTQTVESYVSQLQAACELANAEVLLWFETKKLDGTVTNDWRMRPYTNAVNTWKNY